MSIKKRIKDSARLFFRKSLERSPAFSKTFTIEHGMKLPVQQDLDVYWEHEMADVLEKWGEGNAWSEIEFLLVNGSGKILDIACGTGRNIEQFSKYPYLELYGCDISDFLIQHAVARRISPDRLQVCDATNMPYGDDTFDYAYTIGSIEHFTEKGIIALVSESYRVAKYASFHMLPVSRSGKNEGWMKTIQSFHNNSVSWWLDKFHTSYEMVYVLDSKWSDKISLGKWFICMRKPKLC